MSWLSKRHERVLRDDEAMRAVFKLGDTFQYLGRTCIVVGYGEHEMDIGWIPRLMCDYADDHGVIRHISFTPHEVENVLVIRRNS